MVSIANNMQAVRRRIEQAAMASGRNPASVGLLAVSKTWPADDVREAAATGQRAFGENYVQEGVAKATELADLGLDWHFIGPMQSNKTRAVAETFHWVHSVDRLRIAERLSAQRPVDLPPLNVCLQVNVSGEATKSGCLPSDVFDLAEAVRCLPQLKLRGLMAIPAPAPEADMAVQRAPFARLRDLMHALNKRGFDLDTLSMGMSEDMEAAIWEGATWVRVGTAIFGARGK